MGAHESVVYRFSGLPQFFKKIVISAQGRQGAFFCPHENGTEYVLFGSSEGSRPRYETES